MTPAVVGVIFGKLFLNNTLQRDCPVGNTLDSTREFFAEAHDSGDPGDFYAMDVSRLTTTGAATGCNSGSSKLGLGPDGGTRKLYPMEGTSLTFYRLCATVFYQFHFQKKVCKHVSSYVR